MGGFEPPAPPLGYGLADKGLKLFGDYVET